MIRKFYNHFLSSDRQFARSVANIIGFTPSNLQIFKQAFSHKSAVDPKLHTVTSNERLEYLGDSILSSIVAEYLFQKYPNSNETVADVLLRVHRSYLAVMQPLLDAERIHALAHITGGGITENIPRVIPAGLEVQLSAKAWERPEVFGWLQKTGNISAQEMYKTFNCGIGMTITLAAEHVDKALRTLRDHGEHPVVIGEIRRGDGGVVIHG